MSSEQFDQDWEAFDDETIERTEVGDGGDYFVGDNVREVAE